MDIEKILEEFFQRYYGKEKINLGDIKFWLQKTFTKLKEEKIKLPEKIKIYIHKPSGFVGLDKYETGWNDCLDEIKRLNNL